MFSPFLEMRSVAGNRIGISRMGALIDLELGVGCMSVVETNEKTNGLYANGFAFRSPRAPAPTTLPPAFVMSRENFFHVEDPLAAQ